jgi:GT2 family glycosyltransferase
MLKSQSVFRKVKCKMPTISVIIVSWNAKKYLEECLQSIAVSFEAYDAEIIVVDNASTDGSSELIMHNFPNVRLICNTENLGFAKANNIGINHSQGDYLFLINSDVVVYPNCISLMVDYMEKHTETGLLGPRIIGIDGNVQRSCMGYPSLWNIFCRAVFLDSIFPRIKLFNGFMLNHWAHDSIKEVDVINGCFWLVRRKAVKQIGLLDEEFFIYAEDMDWCKRFNSAGWKVVYFPLAISLHYGGASSSNAPVRFYVEMQIANLQYWYKHHDGVSCFAYIWIILLHQSLRVFGNYIYYLLVPSKRDVSKYKTKRSIATIITVIRNSNYY